ncbi:MAG: DUF4442 domain-containing protein [Flavobacteriales bacterium]|nr:DUF4442 domain-containing protein [Flavobacteriales bacterium]
MELKALFEKAKAGKRGRFILDRVLWKGIPFNRPHRFSIQELTDESVVVLIPFRKKNLNHLNGLHACALATGAEYASGLVMLQHFDPSSYRLIMKRIEIDYHYQGKTNGLVKFELPTSVVESEIKNALETQDAALFLCKVPVEDENGNLLCSAVVEWQIKPWTKVRTKS